MSLIFDGIWLLEGFLFRVIEEHEAFMRAVLECESEPCLCAGAHRIAGIFRRGLERFSGN